jgi:putative ABC transport system substrate-binding protein
MTHFGHRRLTIAAARIDHCAPFRWSQFPVLIARVESQIWRVPGKAMRRREFISLLGGAAASWPLAARAQQAARVPRIGWIAIGTPQGSEFFEAVRQGLRQLGYVEGQSVIIEPRWPADIGDRVPELVRELLALNVQVIVVQGAIVPLVRRVIESTPVVFGYSGDPVEAGLVNSFSRPGGNFTGATFMSYELNAKRVELLREAFPHVKRLAILSNPLHPGEPSELKESEKGAERLGIELSYAQMRSVAEIEPALERIREAGAEGMIVLPDGLVMLHRRKIIEFAALQRIPVISGWSEFARSGGTMTYGPNLKAVFQRLAIYVDKILKGANPGELAVEQPTKFELVINLKAAKALGLEVPPTLLALADEVIEQGSSRLLQRKLTTTARPALGHFRQINPLPTLSACPLRSDRVRTFAPQRIDAGCHK